MSLNSILHKLAEMAGANLSHDIHKEIDETVATDKTDEAGKEDTPNAQES